MADAATTAMGAVPFRVTDPERIPVKRYYDEEFYRLECEKLWPHVWQMACRLEQIPDVGRLGRVQQPRQVGDRRAHQGWREGLPQRLPPSRRAARCAATATASTRASSARSTAGAGTWTARTPSSMAAPVQRGLLEEADLTLKPCRVELWGGCAFINFDDDAPPLRECIGPAGRAARRAPGRQAAGRMVVCHRAAGKLEDRDGSLHGRLSRDADPPAAAGTPRRRCTTRSTRTTRLAMRSRSIRTPTARENI